MEPKKIKIEDLYKDVEGMAEEDWLIQLLNQPPPEAWVKTHPMIANYNYLPIDKVEYLLKKIFKKFRIEVKEVQQMFNAVTVTVRVNYVHPITGEWDYHDGVGAEDLQVKKGSAPSDLSAVNKAALKMALPIAKTVAIKDACDHFGRLFGSDLNRKDQIEYTVSEGLQNKTSKVAELNAKLENKTAVPETMPEPKEVPPPPRQEPASRSERTPPPYRTDLTLPPPVPTELPKPNWDDAF